VDAARRGGLTLEEPAEELRAAGLRATRPRLLVLRFLREQGGHHSADDITAALAAAGEPMLRGSIYNVLGSLVDSGLVVVADAGPGRTLYEAGDGWHHHFVCRACGTILDVPCVVGAKPCLDAGLVGAEVDEAQVIFRGRCPSCAARSGKARVGA
jgi:Fur family ferric uptake transcriptional regulator